MRKAKGAKVVKVKFFGLLRLDLKLKEIEVEAGSVKELLSAVADMTGCFTAKELKGYLIYVNGTLSTKLSGYRTKLADGDTVIMMNPASGG
jgi:Molybdopterin converting factor, small subunit